MILFDECFTQWESALQSLSCKPLTPDNAWGLADRNQLIFPSDMAYELGGRNLAAVSGIGFTDNESFIPKDEILLYGPDLGQIKTDCNFARIALVRVNGSALGEGNALYQTLRKIEYARYHVNPQGYMMRISGQARRECVRVGKADIKRGLSFAGVGARFLAQYHTVPAVEAVKLIFVTDPSADFAALDDTALHAEQITLALDHLLQDAKMDCHTCKLQTVCAEVEQMLEKA